MEASVTQIVESLTSKTREKKAVWKESSTKGEYKILFDGATLTIGRFLDATGKFYYVLKILNDEGRVIVKESVYEGDSSSLQLRSLYYAAEEQSLKKIDTLNSIITQLNPESVGIDSSLDFPF